MIAAKCCYLIFSDHSAPAFGMLRVGFFLSNHRLDIRAPTELPLTARARQHVPGFGGFASSNSHVDVDHFAQGCGRLGTVTRRARDSGVEWEMDRLWENGRSGFALVDELTVEFKLTVTLAVTGPLRRFPLGENSPKVWRG